MVTLNSFGKVQNFYQIGKSSKLLKSSLKLTKKKTIIV